MKLIIQYLQKIHATIPFHSTLIATSGSQDEVRVDYGTGSAKKSRPVARRNAHILCAAHYGLSSWMR
jgi:hypothetical protein